MIFAFYFVLAIFLVAGGGQLLLALLMLLGQLILNPVGFGIVLSVLLIIAFLMGVNG